MYRSRLVFFALVLSLFVVAAPAVAQTGYAPDAEESAFLGLINDYRAQNGLGPLALNDALGAAAEHHSYDMATNNYFGHTLFDGTDAGQNIRNFGYTGSTWSENIAAGYAGAQDNLIAWQNSSGHNANMLDPAFDEIGIGRAYDQNSTYGWYWTTTFGGGAAAAGEDTAASETSSSDDGVDAGAAPAENGGGETITWTWSTETEDGTATDAGTEPSGSAESCGQYVGSYC